MSKKIVLTGIIFLIGILFFVLFYYSDVLYKKSKTTGLESTQIGSNIKKRFFLSSRKFKLINQFNYQGVSQDLIAFDDKLYFVNSSSNQIESFNYSGAKMKTMGRKGEAPWENNIIHYIEPTEFGFYVFDSGSQALKKYDNEYKLLKFKKTKGYVLDAIRLHDNLFLIPDEEKVDDYKFSLFDFEKDKEILQQSIKPFITAIFNKFPKTRSDIIFSGYFRRNSLNQVVYVFLHFGAFILFNSDGSIDKIVRTIDGFGLPKPVDIKRSSTVTENTIDPDIIVNYSSCVNKNNLFVLSNVYMKSENDNRVIDVYRISDGIYLHTLILPNQDDGQKCIAIACNNAGIITCLGENMVVKNYVYND